MKNLMDIILDGQQIFEYRLKFAFEPCDKQLERIEQLMSKYDLVESTPLKRTIFQTNPHDFPNLDAGEIWMMDVTLGRGLQHDRVTQQLCEALKVPAGLLLVRNMEEPIQEYLAAAEGDIEFDEEYVPKLTDADYSDAADVDHSDNMGDALADKAAEAKSENSHGYADFMIAGYEQMYPTAKSDVVADQGPTKE